MEPRFCLQCGELLKGRVDKKFCDDQCRTAHNNQFKSDSALMRSINNTLKKNRKILESLIPSVEGKIKVSRKKLEEKGFSFSYYTHVYTTKAGASYCFCYEFGYLPLEGDYFMLVKRQETTAN